MCFFINRTKRRSEKMSLTWLNNNFICKDLYAPFKIDKDSDYIKDLRLHRAKEKELKKRRNCGIIEA